MIMRLPRLVGFSLRVVLLSHKTTNAAIGLMYAATPKAADHPERAFHMLSLVCSQLKITTETAWSAGMKLNLKGSLLIKIKW